MRLEFAILIFWVTVLALMLLFWFMFLGGRRTVGEMILGCFPQSYMYKGGKTYIYLDGEYNRCATIDGVTSDTLAFYNHGLSLPLAVRGRFYAIGYSEDGSSLVYMPDMRHYGLVRLAEFVRKAFSVPEDTMNLPVTASGSVLEEAEGGL